jgi:hypothetical protein
MNMRYWWEIQKARDNSEDEIVGGRIILIWISDRQAGVLWAGLL